MPDFPGGQPQHPLMSNYSVASCLMGEMNVMFNGLTSIASVGANTALYVPIYLETPYLVKKVFWLNGATVSGNVDVGCYSRGGSLLFSCGAIAQATVSVIQSSTLGTAYLLTPGSYYMALAASSATATFQAGSGSLANSLALAGVCQQASNMPLATAAFTPVIATTTKMPFFGYANAAIL